MPDATQKTLYIIDGHAQIFRAYHAIRSLSSPITQEPTNATFGFVGMLLKLFRDCEPDYLVVAIDVSGDQKTFRSQLDTEYKANRDAPPEDLHPQVERIVEICGLFGIPVIGVEGVEADDVIATLVQRLAGRDDLRIRIVSRDKDLQQLLGDRVEMYDIHTDQTIDVEALSEHKGVGPDHVVDMLALMGDTVDNIPGVKGVGAKTAAKLIAQYGSIENLLAHTDELTPRQRENVEAAADRLKLNRELVTLKRDVDFDFDLDNAKLAQADAGALLTMFKQLGFTRHLKDLQTILGVRADDDGSGQAEPERSGGSGAPTRDDDFSAGLFADAAEAASTPSAFDHADPSHFHLIATQHQLDELIARIKAHAAEGRPIAVDTETTSVISMRAELCGVSIALAADDAVYIPVQSPQPDTHLGAEAVLDTLRPVLEDAATAKVGQNLKYDITVLRRHGVELGGVAFDTLIASFLIDPTRSSHKLDNLALAHLNYEMIPLQRLIGAGKDQITFDRVPLDDALVYAAEDAAITLRLREHLLPTLKTMGLRQLFDDLEMPLVPVLSELEYNGIAVDAAELDRQRAELNERIGELRRAIIDTAGVDFNPDSPKQLGAVLFGELGGKAYKRTKTGPSTDSEVLARVADEQQGPGAQVARLVLEYRQLAKLVGTYLEALKQAIHPQTGRIHASFHQTGAATGRLSSSDPNLQNIPIRTEIGRQVRKAFVAPPGRALLSADYSQIELRILAHLSQDPGLLKAFEEDADIHRAVAAEVFGVPPDDVTGEQRSAAKMVNFGIVYGITPWGLARRLNPGEPDKDRAAQIIDDYRKRYSKIDQFLARCVEQARTRGHVTTIMGRRRPIPQIAARQANVQQLGQRMAINSVVQGSAADLIKLAMVKLYRRIRDQQLPMRMLLQIHDELVFETGVDDVARMRPIVVEEMTGAMALSVPLKVEASSGPDWMAAK